MYYLIYLLFGANKESFINELIYSLLSFNKIAGDWSKRNIQILIYTEDKIHLPEQLADLPIGFVVLSGKEIDEWYRRANGYPLILKARVMSEFLQKFTANGILVDTDTFFAKDPETLFKAIEQGCFVMHLKEYPITRRPEVHSLLQTKTFKRLNGDLFMIDPAIYMWNSGVVGIKADQQELVAEIIYLIEQMSFEKAWPPEERRFIEQTSYSCYLQGQDMPLLPADEYIIHYWFFKPARYLLGNYFNYFHGSDYQESRRLMQIQNLEPEMFASPSYNDLPHLIMKLIKKFSLNEAYFPECLPSDTHIGRILREEMD